MATNNQVEFENAVCIKETDRALLIKLADREEPVWFPQSVVTEDSEVFKEGDEGKLVVEEWFGYKEGLI